MAKLYRIVLVLRGRMERDTQELWYSCCAVLLLCNTSITKF